MIEKINLEGLLLAKVYRKNFEISDGISFDSDPNSSLQFGFMKRDRNYKVKPHIHKQSLRKITDTQEILIVRRGEVICKFFIDDTSKFKEITLNEGDILHVYSGGHSFLFSEESEIIEIKQGPFLDVNEKFYL